MNKKGMIYRNPLAVRFCHICMIVLFILTAFSGLSFFFPSIPFFSLFLGTPQLSRVVHPILGCIIFVLLLFMFINLVRHNLIHKNDLLWLKNIKNVMKGEEDESIPIGKYNAGQKILFWCIMCLITILLITGLIMWRRYFSEYFSINVIRAAIFIHSVAAICLIMLIIGHIYMAIWVKGSIKGMISGYVSRAWALKNHSKWYHDEMEKVYNKEELSQIPNQEQRQDQTPEKQSV